MNHALITSKRFTLWTIQPISIYEALIEKGEVAVFESASANADPKHLYAYEWLIDQMHDRIGPSHSPKQYPFWAWFQWLNYKKNKPDLRSYRLPIGEQFVRLTLEIDSGDVLLSDFNSWENIYAYQLPVLADANFLKNIPEEDLPYLYSEDLFQDQSEKHQNIIKQTWPNIFNLNIGKSWHSKRIQATFWTLKLSDVKKVEHVIGR